MTEQAHWAQVYDQKQPDEVSWYQPHLTQSLDLIRRCDLPPSASIVDVGGGAATLVDDLLDQGFTEVTVIDLADTGLARARARLGGRAAAVRWIQGDATLPLLAERSVDLWHDRAVFHFLTQEERRVAYLEQVSRCVRPNGFVILATFAPDGPERCSGLSVRRYSPQELAATLGPSFVKLTDAREEHVSPRGMRQMFSYVLCQRREVSADPASGGVRGGA